jgi:anti-anti-sigma regulatory factor
LTWRGDDTVEKGDTMPTLAEPILGRDEPLSAPDVCVIDVIGPLSGELRVHNFRDLTQGLLGRGAKNLAINLAQVPYADSYGVGSLVATFNLAYQAGAGIKFFAASERLVDALKRLHLDTVLELYEDEASAVTGFRRDG